MSDQYLMEQPDESTEQAFDVVLETNEAFAMEMLPLLQAIQSCSVDLSTPRQFEIDPYDDHLNYSTDLHDLAKLIVTVGTSTVAGHIAIRSIRDVILAIITKGSGNRLIIMRGSQGREFTFVGQANDPKELETLANALEEGLKAIQKDSSKPPKKAT